MVSDDGLRACADVVAGAAASAAEPEQAEASGRLLPWLVFYLGGYGDDLHAVTVARQLTRLGPEVQPHFDAWYATGGIPDIALNGQHVGDVFALGMDPVSSWLWCDVLARDPGSYLRFAGARTG